MKKYYKFTEKCITKKIKLDNNFEVENNFYYKTHKTRLDKILNHYELIKKIIKVKGDIVELGVFKGISLIRIAQIRDTLKIKKKIYAFDTFKAFPESKKSNFYDSNFPKIFTQTAGYPIVKKKLEDILKKKKLMNIKLIEGNIFESLDIFQKKKIRISLLHLDLDLEEATLFALTKLFKCVCKGGIIILDDYKIHTGIKRAVDNFLKNKKIHPPLFGHNPSFFIKN
jgi:hypothetical protein